MSFSFSVVQRASLLLLAGVLTACGGPEAGTDDAEKKHPDVVNAREMIKQQDLDAAADTLHDLLREHPDMAYAHMQLGFVYQSRQEPIQALYHFGRYLDARPDTENAEVIRDVVDDELKRLARGVEGEGVGIIPQSATNAELQNRLRDTRRDLARARVELRQQQMRGDGRGDEPPPEWAEEKLSLLEEIERLRAAGGGTGVPVPPEKQPEPEAEHGAGRRSYTVKSGDTLSAIAQKMYGKSSRWRDILEANRDQIPASDRLTPGMTLVIPQ